MKREEVAKWNAQRLAVEAEIRSLKTWIREGGERMMKVYDWQTGKNVERLLKRGPGLGYFQDYQQLEALKATATGLYVERAAGRGRLHLRPASEPVAFVEEAAAAT